MEIFWVLFSMFGSILALIIFPLPWVIGLVTIIRWFIERSKAKNTAQSAPVSLPSVSESASPQLNTIAETQAIPVPVPPARVHKEQFNNLNNINVFLYIGAFLVVVASTVFIGAAYTELSGAFKTWFLACFAAVFYGLGIWFYLKFPVVKPAGLTFATIGLVLAPVVGVAYFNYINLGHSGEVVWFFTSLLVFGLYFVSLKILKKAYVAYFLNLVSLSLFESFISLFKAPIYYFGWGMALASMIFLLISKQSRDEEMRKSFYYSSNVFLPVAIFLSLTQTVEFGWLQFGINSLLAATYYLLANFLSEKDQNRVVYFLFSTILVPIGLFTCLVDQKVETNTIILILAILSFGYVVFYELAKKNWTDSRPQILLAVGSILATLIGLFSPGGKSVQLSALIFALFINIYSFVREKKQLNLILGSISFLVLPSLILDFFNKKEPDYLVVVYLIAGLVALWLRIKIVSWLSSAKIVSILTYTVALTVSFFMAFAVGNTLFLMVTILFLAALVYLISEIENKTWILGIFAFLVYFGLLQIVDIWKLENFYTVVILALSGIGLYIAGTLTTTQKSKTLLYAGLIGPFAGAVYGVTLKHDLQLIPIFSLLVGAMLLYTQAKKEKSDAAEYFSYGFGVVAVEWWLKYLSVTELQVYMIINSAYFATLAYLRNLKNDQKSMDVLTYFALGFLTIPMYFQVWGIEKERLARGIIFFGESLALIFVGMGLKNQIVRRWGIGSLIAGVLIAYYSIWFLIGAIGIGLLVFAIIMLTKSAKQNPNI